MKSKTLVTGGAGFMGSHVAKSLLDMGCDVVVLDDLSGGFRENVPSGCEFLKGSILDENVVAKLFKTHKFDVVYHLAAYAAEGLSHFIRRFNYSNNLIGSVTLLNAAIRAGTKRFVFTSSIAVYGSAQVPMREDMIPIPEDPYGIAKRAFELDLQVASEMFGIEHVIFRPHNVYGERQNLSDPYRNVVGIFMNRVMQGKAMPVFGDGTQTRAFTYIADVASIIAKAGFVKEATNKIINIGSDQPIAVIDLARLVAEAFGRNPEIEFLSPRREVHHAFSDHTVLRKVFGNIETTPIEKGIGQMAGWARSRGMQKPTFFTDIEIINGLPESWAQFMKDKI
ncbi:MAG: NAD-dependent epimerase/dehydratase family protein [Deltaproteobacteria bacterium]|nr:NAD-dependent epimerase/dehydratase family protein [Deltaproteobacteria bacterium]